MVTTERAIIKMSAEIFSLSDVFTYIPFVCVSILVNFFFKDNLSVTIQVYPQITYNFRM